MICKRKIDKLDFIKIKNFFSVKDPTKRIKKKNNKLQTRTKYFKTIYSTKGSYLEYTKNSYYSTADPIRKWAKDMKIHFTKLNIHMANKHMKSCSTSQPIKEMPIKATVKYHCTPLSLIMTVSKAGKYMKKTTFYTLLVELLNHTAMLENNLLVSYKIKHT